MVLEVLDQWTDAEDEALSMAEVLAEEASSDVGDDEWA